MYLRVDDTCTLFSDVEKLNLALAAYELKLTDRDTPVVLQTVEQDRYVAGCLSGICDLTTRPPHPHSQWSNSMNIDAIFDWVDTRLHREAWEQIDRALGEVVEQLETYNLTYVFSWLMATFPERSRFPNRAELYSEARKQFPEQDGRTWAGLE